MTDCARQLVTSGEDQQGHDSCPGNERGGRALCCLRGSHLFLSIGAGGGGHVPSGRPGRESRACAQ